MSRNLSLYWIFLWITASADANYVLSSKNLTWHEARTGDNFATPTIQVNNSSITVNITIDIKNKEAWVGYYSKEVAFAYIGCGRLSIAQSSVILPESKNSPGLCYSMCNKTYQNYIGLKRDKCLCMRDMPNGNIRLPVCNISSEGTWWVAGGDDQYISFYKRMKTGIRTTASGTVGNCLVFQKNKERWWSPCIKDFHILCKKDKNVHVSSHNGQSYLRWSHYVKACFENNSFPITYNDINSSSIEEAISQSWSNVIRSDVIFGYNEILNNSTSQENVYGKYGYVTQSGNITLLLFTKYDQKKQQLLQINTVTKPTSAIIQVSTNSHMTQKLTTGTGKITYTNNVTFKTRMTSQAQVSDKTTTSPIENNTEGFQSKAEENGSESSNVSVPVSVSVATTILVAILVVVIITLKRGGKIPRICAKGSTLDNSPKITVDKIPAENNVYNESAISDYEQISELKDNNNEDDVKPDLDVGNGNYGHTYFVLEPGSRESHTDGDMSDYKKDEIEINDDYNTLRLNKTFGAKADDTYDTTEKAAIKLKALRETGCEKEFPEKLNENEEDTYNHINRNLLKNNKTDNIYGVTDNQEDDYGDVHNGCEKNRHNGDDTYSHLNTTH